MIDTLYDCFKHWTEKGSCFLYSDPHFDDEDCKIMDPNWVDPQVQVDKINKLVHKNDTLVILGDIGNVEWIKKLKAGYKVLITGNHDIGASKYKRKERYEPILSDMSISDIKVIHPDFVSFVKDVPLDNAQMIYCDNKLFDEVYTGPLVISDKIILSHEPIPNITWALNIHGHDHSKFNNFWNKDPYHCNVCSNVINYTPVNLKDIIKSGTLNRIKSLHRITIDKASSRKG